MTKLSQDTRTRINKLLQPAQVERLDQLFASEKARPHSYARTL